VSSLRAGMRGRSTARPAHHPTVKVVHYKGLYRPRRRQSTVCPRDWEQLRWKPFPPCRVGAAAMWGDAAHPPSPSRLNSMVCSGRRQHAVAGRPIHSAASNADVAGCEVSRTEACVLAGRHWHEHPGYRFLASDRGNVTERNILSETCGATRAGAARDKQTPIDMGERFRANST